MRNGNFQDRFSNYLARKMVSQRAEEIVFNTPRQHNQPHPLNYESSISCSGESITDSINSSAYSFPQTSSISKHPSHAKTVSIKKRHLIKVKDIEDNTCPICLDQCKDKAELSCRHTFCFECLQEWLKTSSRCPYCREDCSHFTRQGQQYRIQKK